MSFELSNNAFSAALQLTRSAFKQLSLAPHAQRLAALEALACALDHAAANPECEILQANALDLKAAKAAGIAASLLDRLTLNPERLRTMARDVRQVAGLDDPVLSLVESRSRADDLQLERRRVPIGVIAVIYEARPNVTIDCAALGLKSGNAVVLRGGKEANHSNAALARLVHTAMLATGIAPAAVTVIPAGERAELQDLLALDGFIDLVIPRGGAGLHQLCKSISKIPVLTGGIGICHLLWHSSARADAALEVVYNAKVQRPSVCNALDVLLLDRSCAAENLPKIVARLGTAGVSFKLCAASFALAQSLGIAAQCELASETDFDTEWLGLTLSVRLFEQAEEAIQHVQAHSSGHSDGILTEDPALAEFFLQQVDSAAVYHNASTRFTDGSEMGMGAEMAVSTERLHARGPVGLNELMSSKWVVRGNYHVRA